MQVAQISAVENYVGLYCTFTHSHVFACDEDVCVTKTAFNSLANIKSTLL